MTYVCPCGYVYDPAVGDPDNGIAPGTAWEDVPEDWVCPVCGLGKTFSKNNKNNIRSWRLFFRQDRFCRSGSNRAKEKIWKNVLNSALSGSVSAAAE